MSRGDFAYPLRSFVQTFGASQLFLARLIAYSPRAFLRPSLILEQIHATGSLSLLIIMISGLFVGMVLGLQGFDSLSRFGAGGLPRRSCRPVAAARARTRRDGAALCRAGRNRARL